MSRRYAAGHCPEYGRQDSLARCACGTCFPDWPGLVDHCRRPVELRVVLPVCPGCGVRASERGRFCADCGRERRRMAA
jgi:hypothetical protein